MENEKALFSPRHGQLLNTKKGSIPHWTASPQPIVCFHLTLQSYVACGVELDVKQMEEDNNFPDHQVPLDLPRRAF